MSAAAIALDIGVRAGERGGLQPPPQSGKTGENSGKLSGNFVPLDIDLHEVQVSLSVRNVAVWPNTAEMRGKRETAMQSVNRPTQRSRANAMQSSMIWLLKKTTSD